jgi:hypothetical protein
MAQKQWEILDEECCRTTQIAFVKGIFVALFFICTIFTLFVYVCGL